MLTRVEVKVLNTLSKEWKDWDSISRESGLNKDGVARTLYFLSQKGYAEIREERKEKYILTEKGREYLEKGFPEEDVEKYEGYAVKDLPSHILRRLGFLKGTVVDIREGKLIYKGGKYVLRDALEKIAAGREVEGRLIKELLKEGLVEKVAERKIWGRLLKKAEVEEGIDVLSREVIESGEWKEKPFRPFNIDLSAVGLWRFGLKHVVKKAIENIKVVFSSMGFEEMEGNYVESAFWNFDVLFQPQDHPSRELADTFYLKDSWPLDNFKLVESVRNAHERFWNYRWNKEEAEKVVLRTHTTVLSARTLVERKRGKFFAVGKVFRNEAVDYKHLAEFHQIEGIVAEEDVSFRHLLGILKEFYRRLGFEEIRFRPSYFPYTEPSLEIEVWFEPKKEWVELGGAGMFRREMLESWGVDVDVLAWGLSLERPLMMFLGLEDIRLFYKNNLDFLKEKGAELSSSNFGKV